MPARPQLPRARFGDLLAEDLVAVTDDPAVIDRGGRWAVVVDFEGTLTAARFRTWRRADATADAVGGRWSGVPASRWDSSLGPLAHAEGVDEIRARIAAGDVYQVNLCRVLETPLDDGTTLHGLHAALATAHPAPYASHVYLPEHDLDVASASPELFLRRDREHLVTRPIKGTAATADAFLDKDRAENVMIVDLMRNDLGRVCEPGTVRATALCAPEHHPGLVHLVSTVEGTLSDGVGWGEILAATFPPGSVVGAPKLAALDVIRRLEPVPRGPYCGAIGWIDADDDHAELAVGIRTFWRSAGTLRLGTGGGVTWDSDPEGEWRETELKARRLLAVAEHGV